MTLPECTVAPPVTEPPVDRSCPKGKNVCYTDDCQCIMGSCNPSDGTDLANILVGYTGAAGSYSLSGTCENGKGLSNAIKIVSASVCTKEEPSGSDTVFTVDVDASGNVLTPFSMKCGKDCFLYGTFPIACN